MSSISGLLEALKLSLKSDYPEISFYSEYENRAVFTKLQEPLGVIALKRLVMNSAALYDYVAEDENGSVFGKNARAELTLSLFFGAEKSAEALKAKAFDIADSLLFSEYNIKELSVSKTEFVKEKEAFRVNIDFTLEAILTKTKSEEEVLSYRISAQAD